jgi:membrane protein DedA with SNARE-associated domain
MKAKIVIPRKFYFILFSSALAILLVSFTVGRELYADKTESIFSFALIHFAGYLFFLLMPVELAFVFYLPFYPTHSVVLVALFTAVAAQVIDYYIGRLIRPNRIFELMGKKRIVKAERNIQRYGIFTILVFNLFPLSSPLIALAAGMLKFNFRKFILVSALGLLVKYAVLSLCFM